MLRAGILLCLSVFLINCGGTDAQNTTGPESPPTSELQFNEKGRIPYSAVLTFADGPFAGSYELEYTKDNYGSIQLAEYKADHVEKHPHLAGKSQLSAHNMTTTDGSFGIANMGRQLNGTPSTGHLGSFVRDDSPGNDKCGKMQLHTEDAPGTIRHVYVYFTECKGLDVNGFGNTWKTNSRGDSRNRPVSASFSERVLIEDINSTADTNEKHETTLTLTFVGKHSEELAK